MVQMTTFEGYSSEFLRSFVELLAVCMFVCIKLKMLFTVKKIQSFWTLFAWVNMSSKLLQSTAWMPYSLFERSGKIRVQKKKNIEIRKTQTQLDCRFNKTDGMCVAFSNVPVPAGFSFRWNWLVVRKRRTNTIARLMKLHNWEGKKMRKYKTLKCHKEWKYDCTDYKREKKPLKFTYVFRILSVIVVRCFNSKTY